MAQLVPKLTQEEIDEAGDITKDLASLSFEGALSEEEKKLLFLRERAHALTVVTCAQATYMVAVLKQASAVQLQLQNPSNRNALKLMRTLDSSPKESLRIGIIGCGRLGSHIAHCLLTIAEINPLELRISTRRPELLGALSERGVICCHDNKSIASWCDLLFLCILPAQVTVVAEELKESLPSDTVLYSLVKGVGDARMVQLLGGHTNLISSQIKINYDPQVRSWDFTQEVATALSKRPLLEQSCPLMLNRPADRMDLVTSVGPDFFRAMMYALVNILTKMNFNRFEVVDLINTITLGESESEPLEEKLTVRHFELTPYESGKFFEPIALTYLDETCSLEKKFKSSPYLCQKFVAHYCQTFQQYLDWRAQLLTRQKNQ